MTLMTFPPDYSSQKYVRDFFRFSRWAYSPVAHTLNSTEPQILYVQKGPSIFKMVSPVASLTSNSGLSMLHVCSTVPTSVPGGLYTSITCLKQKRKHHCLRQLMTFPYLSTSVFMFLTDKVISILEIFA